MKIIAMNIIAEMQTEQGPVNIIICRDQKKQWTLSPHKEHLLGSEIQLMKEMMDFISAHNSRYNNTIRPLPGKVE